MQRLAPLFFLAACGLKADPVPPERNMPPASDSAPAATIASSGVEDPALRDLLERHWDASMRHSPTWATELGDHRFDDQLAEHSLEAGDAWTERMVAWLAAARALDRRGMSAADLLNLRLFVASMELGVAQARDCRLAEWTVSPRSNGLSWLASLPKSHPKKTQADAANLLARFELAPSRIDQRTEALRVGLDGGRVATGRSVELAIEMVRAELERPHKEQVLLEPTRDDRPSPQGWAESMRSVVDVPIRDALLRHVAFLQDELLPAARPAGQEGIVHMQGGDVCYATLVRQYTSLDVSADDRHEVGLRALQGIHVEFQDLGESLWGTRDLPTIFERLRTDPELYFDSAEAVEAKANEALGRARAAMPEFFGVLPKAPVEVKPIPAHEAPYTYIAYYQPASPDGERPGVYYINTFAPQTRPRHEAEALAWHEAIPGHHLQIAIAQELPDTPAFRKHLGMTAYVEGWALYTERLADEMGLYSGDLDRMGMLSFDAWRAGRLVVDTGIHHKGWSRKRAEQFLADNTPLALNNIENEVDRYIGWPGQALGYKTGQIVMWQLRRRAEETLAERFDLRAFHDVVLRGGPVPLPVLEDQVDAWIKGQLARPDPPSAPTGH